MPETWIRRPGFGVPHCHRTLQVHTRTTGNSIVAVVPKLTHRRSRVRGRWRTGSNNSGAE